MEKSGDMLPTFAVMNKRHLRSGDTVSGGENRPCYALITKAADVLYILLSKMRPTVLLTERMITSMPSLTITHVFDGCAEVEMLRVTTRRIITPMKNHQSQRDCAASEAVGDTVGTLNTPAPTQPAVPLPPLHSVPISSPQPAPVRAADLVDARPKSRNMFFRWDHMSLQEVMAYSISL